MNKYAFVRHALLLALCTLIATACGTAATGPAMLPTVVATVPAVLDEGDTLRLVYWQPPSTLNPHLAFANRDLEAARLTYEPLASFNKEGVLVPFLAVEIPSLENGGVAADGRSVTWNLKPGVRWSDGQPFTAADVRFTWQYITNPQVASGSAGTYALVADVVALDQYRVQVRFKSPNPSWAQPFVGQRGMILPEHVFAPFNNSGARDAPANLQPVGTGPYRFVSYKPQETLFLGNQLVNTNRVLFEANPFFREQGKPAFKRLELRGGSTASEAARLVLEARGPDAADYAWNLQVDDALLQQLETAGRGRVLGNLGPNVERIAFNLTDPRPNEGERSSLRFPNPFFADVRVRQAFALAIDRERIAGLFPRESQPSANLIVAPPANQSPNTTYRYDLERAAQLLDEAGWVVPADGGTREKDGRRLVVDFQASNNGVRQQIQQIVRESLAQIDVEVRLIVIDVSLYGETNLADPNQSNVFRFFADLQVLFDGNLNPDPDDYLVNWTSDPAQIPQQENNWSGLNFERFRSDDYDRLYQEFVAEIDPQRRRQLVIAMNDTLVNEFVLIPLVHRSQVSAVSNRITGVDLTPWEADVWNIKDWRRAP